ncbi:ADP-ribose pyrophosphatase YjhB, NUDIX family [Frankineae bacterium MT45]|nr:ADP-ribose pyrophosphatase YjhB, NUDIX family [Frankineae bacterium MT45]
MADQGSEPIPRVGARVLLLDPNGRLLLIHEHYDYFGQERRTHWITPGGGIEADETLQQAAAREVYEETGIVIELAPQATPVHRTGRLWSGGGNVYDQVDHFFVVRLEAEADVVAASPTPEEVASAIGHRWWSASELATTDERLLPPDIANLLARINADDAADRVT